MVDNTNRSKTESNNESGIQKYIGVASVNVLAINPNNEKLRQYGWQIPEDAKEPQYASSVQRDGKTILTNRIRFLVQIMDLENKPVIPMDFWVHDEFQLNKDATKCKIIDSYVRTAWATKEDIRAKKVPQYANGPAAISEKYTLCHVGEENLLNYLFKYLNITPFRVFDKTKNAYVPSSNPGRITIDDWKKLCSGDVSEIADYVALQPDNCVKVVLGINVSNDNKTYQTFLPNCFLSNGSFVNKDTGEYSQARKKIDEFLNGNENSSSSFEATPVREWKEVASEVHDNSDEIPDAASEEPMDQVPFPDAAADENDDTLPF